MNELTLLAFKIFMWICKGVLFGIGVFGGLLIIDLIDEWRGWRGWKK